MIGITAIATGPALTQRRRSRMGRQFCPSVLLGTWKKHRFPPPLDIGGSGTQHFPDGLSLSFRLDGDTYHGSCRKLPGLSERSSAPPVGNSDRR